MEATTVGENGSSPRERDLPPNPLGGVYRQCLTGTRFVSPCTKSLIRHASLVKERLLDVKMEETAIEKLETEKRSGCPGVDFIPIVRSGGWADIGTRKTMEDVYVCFDDFLHGDKHLGPSAFYGVFDGHGGMHAANFVCDNLPKLILEDAEFPREIEKVIATAFLQTDNAFAEACSIDAALASETTALAAVLLVLIFYMSLHKIGLSWVFYFSYSYFHVKKNPNSRVRSLVVANVGDCRVVLCRRGKAVEMSTDHKPGCLKEMKRIESYGGYVSDGYLNGQLSVARALGDWHMEGLKVSAGSGGPNSGPLSGEPEMMRVKLTEEDEFLIIGCDGLWDVFRSQNAVDFARRKLREHNDPLRCCQELIGEALKRNSGDNLAVVVVCFHPKSPPSLSMPRSGVHRSISPEGLKELKSIFDSLGI